MLEHSAVSRRGFLKLAAITGAAAAVSGTAVPLVASADTAESTGSSVQRIRSGCRSCGKMECGVWVTVENGRVVRIEGDDSAMQSRGNCCSKSQSALQMAYHPDRLRYPMKRTTPRGENPNWERITWEEAWDTTNKKSSELIEKYGQRTLMKTQGTSRIWAGSDALVKFMGTSEGMQFGAGQICKGPRMLVNDMTDFFASYWKATTDVVKGEVNTVYVQWGTACEYSNYDTSGRVIVDTAQWADTHILVDPRLAPLGKEAEIWLPLRPGTDGALALCWTKLVIDNELYDDLFVKRWTNAPFLVCEDIEPTGSDLVSECADNTDIRTILLKESDIVEGGSLDRYMVWDNISNGLIWFDSKACEWQDEGVVYSTTGKEYCGGWLPDPTEFNPERDPALYGEFDVTLKDGRQVKVRPVWEYYVERVEPYTVEKAAEICDLNPDDIERACMIWATRKIPDMPNGSIHFQLATDHSGYCHQCIRTLDLLNDIVGSLDMPGCGRGITRGTVKVLPNPSANNPKMPKYRNNYESFAYHPCADTFPLLRWYHQFTDATSLVDAMIDSDPYPIKCGVSLTGNFMNQGNAQRNWEALKQLEFYVVGDLWHVPQSDLADILMPSAMWLELDFPRISQGPAGGQGATCKAVDPPGEALPDLMNGCGFAKVVGIPFNTDKSHPYDYDVFLDSLVVGHEGMTWAEYKEYFQEHGWWDVKKVNPEEWGTYRRWETGAMHWKGGFGVSPAKDKLPGFYTPTKKVEIWSTITESILAKHFDADTVRKFVLPDYEEPKKTPVSAPDVYAEYPFIITTGSRNPTYFHSEHRQLPWCRELWTVPRLEMNPADAERLGIKQGDWVWIETPNGKVRQIADLYYGIKPGVVNANHTWWYPELDQVGHGWELSNINNITWAHDQDPVQGTSTLRAYLCNVYKATPENSPFGNPVPCGEDGTEIITTPTDPRLKEWLPDYESSRGEGFAHMPGTV